MQIILQLGIEIEWHYENAKGKGTALSYTGMPSVHKMGRGQKSVNTPNYSTRPT